ncbi:hypothetical protein HDU76_013771, partial [Blyttiomyces sp. JEL0837]
MATNENRIMATPADNNSTLHVGYFHKHVKKVEIESFFAKCGPCNVLSIHERFNSNPHKPETSNYAFVKFQSNEQAKRALQSFQGAIFPSNGKRLILSFPRLPVTGPGHQHQQPQPQQQQQVTPSAVPTGRPTPAITNQTRNVPPVTPKNRQHGNNQYARNVAQNQRPLPQQPVASTRGPYLNAPRTTTDNNQQQRVNQYPRQPTQKQPNAQVSVPPQKPVASTRGQDSSKVHVEIKQQQQQPKAPRLDEWSQVENGGAQINSTLPERGPTVQGTDPSLIAHPLATSGSGIVAPGTIHQIAAPSKPSTNASFHVSHHPNDNTNKNQKQSSSSSAGQNFGTTGAEFDSETAVESKPEFKALKVQSSSVTIQDEDEDVRWSRVQGVTATLSNLNNEKQKDNPVELGHTEDDDLRWSQIGGVTATISQPTPDRKLVFKKANKPRNNVLQHAEKLSSTATFKDDDEASSRIQDDIPKLEIHSARAYPVPNLDKASFAVVLASELSIVAAAGNDIENLEEEKQVEIKAEESTTGAMDVSVARSASAASVVEDHNNDGQIKDEEIVSNEFDVVATKPTSAASVVEDVQEDYIDNSHIKPEETTSRFSEVSVTRAVDNSSELESAQVEDDNVNDAGDIQIPSVTRTPKSADHQIVLENNAEAAN